MHQNQLMFFFKNIYLFQREGGERERKREGVGREKHRFVFPPMYMHSLADYCRCPDWGVKPATLAYGTTL